MRCLLCNSHRLLKFIDGFGEPRVYCHSCGRSYLETITGKINDQKSLREFDFTGIKMHVPQHFGV